MKHKKKLFSNLPLVWNDPFRGFFLFLLLSFTVFRALIVVPHYYMLTHYFFSYKFGLIKRGLVGTLFQPLINEKNNEQIIFIISLFSALMLSLLLVGLLFKWITFTKEDPLLSLAGFAFFSSPFISFLANDFAYFDSILYIITLASLWCIMKGRHIWTVIVLNIAGVLIQEIYLVIGFPLILFACTFQHFASSEYEEFKKESLKPFLKKIFLLIISTATAYLLIFKGKPSPELRSYLEGQGLFSEFWINIGLWAQERSLYEGWLAGFKHLKSEYLFQILPTTFFFIILSFYAYIKMLPVIFSRREHLFVILLIVACSIAPVFLILVAWDVGRILSFSNMNSFLVFLTIIYMAKEKPNFIWNKAGQWLYSSSVLMLSIFNLIVYYWLPLMFTHENEYLNRDFEVITFFDFLSKYFD